MYYVIADIHGQSKLLESAIYYLKTQKASEVIFLGDYVDRGPDSLGVIDKIINLKNDMNVTCLEGNHENMLRNSVYGVSEFTNTPEFFYCQTFKNECGGHLEDKYVDFLKSLIKFHTKDSNVFAHAAYDGMKSGFDQEDNVLLWYRYMHLQEFNDPKRHLTHGHTPVNNDKPYTWGNRTCLDMGAMYGKRICIGKYEDGIKGPVGYIVIYSTGEIVEY